MRNRVHPAFGLMGIILLLSGLFTACSSPPIPNVFNPVLAISEPPALGKPVKVSLTFTPIKQYDTYTLRIVLSPGVYEVVDSEGANINGESLEKTGISSTSASMEIIIKSKRSTSDGEIIGYVRGESSQQSPQNADYLYIVITDQAATVSETQPQSPPGIPTIKVT